MFVKNQLPMDYQDYDLSEQYSKHMKIEYKGVLLSSVLELSFVLQIEDEFSWIHEQKSIHYNPKTFAPTIYLTKDTGRYTPDFLIRKHDDNTSYIVEVKPKIFHDSVQMHIRNKVVTNYISFKNFDYQYLVISEDDIKLNKEKSIKRHQIIQSNKYLGRKLRQYAKDDKYRSIPVQRFSSIPNINHEGVTLQDYKRFVKYGTEPQVRWW